MLSTARQIVERAVIGDSVPRLARWGRQVPRPIVERLKAEAFVKVFRYTAQRQKFLARKLREHGIDPERVRRPEDLGPVFTTAEDLLSYPPEDFLCREPEAVFETTGTSGGPKRVYFSYRELDQSAHHEAAALYHHGVRPGDRVVCAFDAGYWISSWVTFLAAKKLDLFCSAIGKPAPEDFYSRWAVYRYNVIAADPTWLVSLSQIAQKKGKLPVKLIMAAGDRMTDVYRSYVQDVLGAPVVLGYGSTESGGGAGMECQRRDGYHLDEFDFFFEIIEPDAEGYGEMVMTTLARRTMPLVRYRVRDITRFVEGACPCGVTLQKITRIRGRRDEMVVMGAGNMHPEIFERVLAGVSGISNRWQVAVRQEGLRDILEFRLEVTNGVSPQTIEQAIQSNLQTRYPEVWANQACDMYQIAFRFLEPGTLAWGRKPKRLVDEREG